MQTRRSYHEFCGLAKALDIVGERWTLLIVRNLTLGPLRYSELLRGLPGITTNLLAKRLREMEGDDLIERLAASPGSPTGHVYRLAALGQALEPAVQALGRWGWHWMARPAAGDHRSLEWLLVAMRRRYRGGLELSVELVADQVPYRIVARKTRVAIARGPAPDPSLILRGTPLALAKLLLDGTLDRSIVIDGTKADLDRLLAGFDQGDYPMEAAG